MRYMGRQYNRDDEETFEDYLYHEGKLYKRVGTETEGGYRRVKHKRKSYLEHRLIWRILKGVWPDGDIDHINCVRNDNRIENLREATHSQNMANSSESWGSSGVKGVYIRPDGTIVAMCADNYLGTFKTVELAKEAYMKFATDRWGEYAKE